MTRLLVVDDDPDLLVLLSAHYGAKGYTVAVAQSCEEALRLSAENRPDAVLLDFCLPKTDGARFIAVLRAGETTKKTPVVVMSAASADWVGSRLPPDPLVRQLEKPFEFAALDSMLESLMAAAARP